MNPANEIIYRLAFGLLWVVYFGVRLYFQRQITAGKEYTRLKPEQDALLFRIFALAFLLLAFYFLTPLVDFAALPLPGWLRWTGAVITCAGILLFGWSHQALGQNWTAVLALAKEHHFVQAGPYRVIRHPMYSAFFVLGIGFALLSANGLVAVVYLAPLLVMYLSRVSVEEQMMVERFGDAYREYMKHSGRLWPRL